MHDVAEREIQKLAGVEYSCPEKFHAKPARFSLGKKPFWRGIL